MSFSQQIINQVWNKAYFVDSTNEANGYRKDQCGAWIQKNAYGNRNDKYGWEIDHITPKSNGGTDQLSNLRPLHWGNNAARQNGRLNTNRPAVRANGTKNEKLTQATLGEVYFEM
ncbi:HNH endonuclease [Xenorhabdus sp. XENO-1]|uniref:HNH endonuclease signature motif containing protein n=1 Tax=Xenorhabdus bovienii TaxID=40576 RepID=UPI0020CA28EA|nr:HNH endonuclease [Xenorhabdus bovienii]MCP9267279.1 HNH endonuclease [Xenorhabdus bovienii subsp. africana]